MQPSGLQRTAKAFRVLTGEWVPRRTAPEYKIGDESVYM